MFFSAFFFSEIRIWTLPTEASAETTFVRTSRTFSGRTTGAGSRLRSAISVSRTSKKHLTMLGILFWKLNIIQFCFHSRLNDLHLPADLIFNNIKMSFSMFVNPIICRLIAEQFNNMIFSKRSVKTFRHILNNLKKRDLKLFQPEFNEMLTYKRFAFYVLKKTN